MINLDDADSDSIMLQIGTKDKKMPFRFEESTFEDR